MIFQINIASAKPVYQQLIDQIKFAVASGVLQTGDRLPAIRDVAVQVRVNRNTVARVYSELEREGILYTRAGQGAFVSDRGSLLSKAEQKRQLTRLLDEFLTQARLFNISRERAEEMFQDRAEAIFRDSEENTGGKSK
jgi:GntR family transcriptional regulator